MSDSTKKVYDVIGIGLGPFNLGLAALLDDVTDVSSLFFERKKEFQWHPDMLIEGTTLQVPFLADLVSMVNVKSEYSFLHYLQEHRRLYHFYFLEKFHIPRKEYNHYCRWVSEQLTACCFGKEVQQVSAIEQGGETLYQVTIVDVETGRIGDYAAKNIALGIGTEPSIPEQFLDFIGSTVFHTSNYLSYKNVCNQAESVVVIGSGQSAAEVFLDIAEDKQEHGGSLEWYTRSKGFFPMEYSKLGLEYFSPDYTDFFYELPQWKKDILIQNQDLLYKGISSETISDIYAHLYERSIGAEEPPLHLQAMTELIGINPKGKGWELNLKHLVSEEKMDIEADAVILGTGYQPRIPNFLQDVNEEIARDDKGRFVVEKGYALKTSLQTNGDIYIQNGELHSHGVGAPDLGLGAHRNAVIINQIAGREVYAVQAKNVFQTFGTKKACVGSYR